MRALSFEGRRLSLTIEPMCWLVMGAFAFSWRNPSNGAPLWSVAVVLAALMLSLLVHEGGHAAAVLLFGGSARVRLHALGGETRHETRLSTPRQFFVTAAGPLAGFAAMGACYGLARFLLPVVRLPPAAVEFLLVMISINLFWSAVNLLPVLPMDGGKLLALLLTARYGAKGLKFVYGVGILLGGALALWGLSRGLLLTAATFGLFAASGVQSWRALARRVPQDDDPALLAEFRAAQKLAEEGREDASARLIDLRKRAGRGRLYEDATELLGLVLARGGQKGAAVELLTSVESSLAYESRLFLMQLLAQSDAHERALAVGRALFPQGMDPRVAYLNAAAEMGRGDRDAALGWLKTAARRGMPDMAARLKDEVFAPLRGTPDFADLERAARGE